MTTEGDQFADALTKAEYDQYVAEYVGAFLDGYDDAPDPDEIPNDVWEDARYDSWFTDNHSLVLYASIIEHAEPTHQYNDWETACDSGGPAEIVERFALYAFENDVTERAIERTESVESVL